MSDSCKSLIVPAAEYVGACLFIALIVGTIIGIPYLAVTGCQQNNDCLRRQSECAPGEEAIVMHDRCSCLRAMEGE